MPTSEPDVGPEPPGDIQPPSDLRGDDGAASEPVDSEPVDSDVDDSPDEPGEADTSNDEALDTVEVAAADEPVASEEPVAHGEPAAAADETDIPEPDQQTSAEPDGPAIDRRPDVALMRRLFGPDPEPVPVAATAATAAAAGSSGAAAGSGATTASTTVTATAPAAPQARERELAGLFDPAFLAETRNAGGGTSVVPRAAGDGPHGTRSRRRIAAIVALAGVGTIALLWLAAWFLAGAGVAPGTSVLGVDIGGMSRDAAEQRLRTTLGSRAERPVQVSVGGQEADLTPGQAGIRFDAQATVANAGGRDWRPTRLLAAFFGDDQVDPVVTVDRGKFDPAVTAAARGVERPAREGGIEFRGTSAEPVAPVSGTMVDRAAAAAAVETAFLRSGGPIVLPMQPVQPRIGRDEVERAMREFAEPALSGPVTVTAGGKSVRIPTRRLAPALSVRPGDDGRLVPVVDGELVSAAIRRLDRTFEQPPKDATIKIVGGRPQVVAGEDGRTVDPAKLAAGILPALTSTDDREVEVELGLTKPKVTTEQIAALGIREQLSSFRQGFPYARYRVANIGRAARYVEGTIVEPGEVFSMNDTIKERTEANGYVIGTIIDGGRFRRELGGGVSTITTAMWTAAFYAGLERVEQRAHSLYISRYRAGLEATVSYGNLDLRFRNNTPHAVLITTKMERNGITITMWGTKTYDKIVGVNGPRRNYTTPRVVYDAKPDCEPQSGVAGFDITVTRQFYKDGVVVKSEPFETHYDVTNEIRCGTAPKATPPPLPPPSGG